MDVADRMEALEALAEAAEKRAERAERERDELRLAILGGEDLPGVAATVSIEDTLKALHDSKTSWCSFGDDALARATAAEAALADTRRRLNEAVEALKPFAKLAFSFDGFDLDPAALVFRGREYGRFRSDDHAAFQRMIDAARAALLTAEATPDDQ